MNITIRRLFFKSINHFFRRHALFILLLLASIALLPGCGKEIDIDTPFDDILDATSEVSIIISLDSTEEIPFQHLNPLPFNELDPLSSSNYKVSVTVDDYNGDPHIVNIYLRKNQSIAESNGWASDYSALGGTQWEWFAVVGASDTKSGNTEIQAAGRLEFNTTGALNLEVDLIDDDPGTFGTQYDSPSGSQFTVNFGFSFIGSSIQQFIEFDFGTSIAEGGSGLDSTTASNMVVIYETLNPEALIPVGAFDVTDPVSTSNHLVNVYVYDSLGIDHEVTVYFRKSVDLPTGNTWQWYAVVDATDTMSGNTEVQANGTITFNSNGYLNTESAVTFPTGGFDFAGGAAADQIIIINFGTSITTDGGTGQDGTTQFDL